MIYLKKTLITIPIFLYFTILSLISPKSVYAQVLFSDNFDDGDALGWTVIGSPGWNVTGGQYGILLNPGLSNTLPDSWNFSWTNVSYDLDLTGVQGVDKNILLKFVNTSNFIELHINGDGMFVDKASTVGGAGTLASNGITLSNGVIYHFRFEIYDNGNIKVYLNNSLIFNVNETAPLLTNWKVGLRAGTGGVPITEVWFDNVVVTQLDAPTPTPTPTPTATSTSTPTPTPTATATPTIIPTSTPIPVTKAVFVPGFGASWNANAFANCTFDPNPNNWSLASYAESIYQPILNALTSAGWNTKPFYFDWRMRIPDSFPVLSTFINSNTASGEKVNLLGHSMGGLLSAGYVTTNGTGKTNSLMTIGSPLKGVVQSYPAWSGGDIWNDDFITKIATTLFLKHCGGIFNSNREAVRTFIPSTQNFLPIYDYLKYFKTNNFKPWNVMTINHGWFNDSFNFGGIKFGTLSGTGFDTLSEIVIKDRSKKDAEAGDWEDGKPANKNYSNQGDGTVLKSSSFIASPYSSVINQTHSGLVNSNEGINKILEFLGGPPLTLSSNQNSYEANSALVLIGDPASFWVTGDDGATKKDKNGMISLMNPKTGKYKLSVIPRSNETLLVLAQFLPNGQIFYKEYNFNGPVPKLKTINFDLDHPKEDILD